MANNASIEKGLPGHEDLVQFSDNHRVGLLPGDYVLEARQLVSGVAVPQEVWKTSRRFTISSESFELSPAGVQSVFPPEGMRGDFWHVLPHIVLERSTMPWERSALKPGSNAPVNPPWLALLVFHPDDPLPNTAVGALQQLGLPVDKDQKPDDQVAYIDVPKTLLDTLMPTTAALSQLTHVRRRLAFLGESTALNGEGADTFLNFIKTKQGSDFQDFTAPILHLMDTAELRNLPAEAEKAWVLRDSLSDDAYEIVKIKKKTTADPALYRFYCVVHETATVVANRLPKPGAQNTVHLVSVEGRYDTAKFDSGTQGNIRLISLKRWSFFCEKEEKTFKGLLLNLNKTAAGDASADWGLPVPPNAATAAPFLQAGFVPLRHHFREGSRSISWYHGPLVPVEPDTKTPAAVWDDNDAEGAMDIKSADQLLIYHAEKGMFDVSYAAAWALGRLLTLQNTRLAFDLMTWKKHHAHHLRQARHLADYGYNLPLSTKPSEADPDEAKEKAIKKWLDELGLLQHVPPNYLLPDPRLLPVESIRFFTLDRRWIACLRDGAFSIGRVFDTDQHYERLLGSWVDPIAQMPVISGFLLRSDLVSGWPKMQMTGYTNVPTNNSTSVTNKSNPNVLTPLRLERFSKNVLFALFPGAIQAVDFFLSPETLHFGLDLPTTVITDAQPEKLIKQKRNPDTGAETADTLSLAAQTHFQDLGRRILKTDQLAKDLSGSATAQGGSLALQLIAGTELVRIVRT
jgi:hypothetical protein